MKNFITNHTNTKALVAAFLSIGVVPVVLGSPGEGKSAMAMDIANEYGLEYVDIRLTQLEPQDLNGFPFMQGKKASYMPMDIIPLEGDPLPAGKEGWLINFDELTSANQQVQAAAYKILLDRKVGQHKIHEKVLIMACGNRVEDNAIVEDMSTALISRLGILHCKLELEEWTEWAQRAGLAWEIISFLNYMPTRFNTFNPDSRDPYGCARTWAHASKFLLKNEGHLDNQQLTWGLAASLGAGLATEFMAFREQSKNLPKIQEIVASPATTYVPREASHRYAVTGMLIAHTTPVNFTAIMQYMERLPAELQVIYLRLAVQQVPEIKKNPNFLQWAKVMGKAINS